MVLLHVEDQADLREEAEERIRILAGLEHEVLSAAHAGIAVDSRVDASNRKRRVLFTLEQDLADHGSRRRFSVRSADRDGHVVIPH